MADASPLTETSGAAGSNEGATAEADEPAHGPTPAEASVWWSYSPQQSGRVTISACDSDFDTVLAVYRLDGPSPSLVGADDDGCGSQSSVTIDADSGSDYAVAVDGYGGDTGSVELDVTTASVTGIGGVLTCDGAPVQGDVNAYLEPNLGYLEASGTSSAADGTYLLDGLDPGSYQVEATLGDAQVTSTRVVVTSGQTSQLDVELCAVDYVRGASDFLDPGDPVAAEDGSLWFIDTRLGGDRLRRILPDGTVESVTGVPTSAGDWDLSRLTPGPDGSMFVMATVRAAIWPNNTRILEVETGGGVVERGSFLVPASLAFDGNDGMWVSTSFDYLSQDPSSIQGPSRSYSAPGQPLVQDPSNLTWGPGDKMWFTNGDDVVRIDGDVLVQFTDPMMQDISDMVAGPDGNLWLTDSATKTVARVSPSGSISFFTDAALAGPERIIAGSDGNIWVTDPVAGLIAKVTTAGVITTYPEPDLEPFGIANGVGDRLWFVDRSQKRIGWTTTSSGSPLGYLEPEIRRPYGLAEDATGGVWFTNGTPWEGAIGPEKRSFGRIGTDSELEQESFDDLDRAGPPVVGPDGRIWFTLFDSLASFAPGGELTEIDLGFKPDWLAAGQRGDLWVADFSTHAIVRLDGNGSVIERFEGDEYNYPSHFAETSGHDLWFVNQSNNIARLSTASGEVLTVDSPETSRYVTDLFAAQDGSVWFSRAVCSYCSDAVGSGIGRISPDGSVTFERMSNSLAPTSLAVSDDGAVWLTSYYSFAGSSVDYNSSIVRWDPDGRQTIWHLDGPSKPGSVETSSDGSVWFTTVSAIGRLSPPADAAQVPAPPTAVSAEPGDGEVSVSWVAPVDDGGSLITGYTVTASPGGASCSTASATSCAVGGLTNGVGYSFTVVATNAVGDSGPSAPSAVVVPVGVPGVPTGVVAGSGDGSLTVSWAAPANDGGSPVTGYTATADPGGASCSTDGSALECSIGGLENGTSYRVRVTATNAVGTSGESSPSAPVVPLGLPGAPMGVVAVAGDGEVSVSWVAPGDDGGSPITGYVVSASPGGASCSTDGSTNCVVGGLTNGVGYSFTVLASSGVGDSVPSAASAVVVPFGIPGSPTGVTVDAGDGELAVSWEAPVDDGGSPVTGYTATADPPEGSGGVDAPAAGEPVSCVTDGTGRGCAITGLDNGVTYEVTVRATNAAGDSSPSVRVSATPRSPVCGPDATGGPFPDVAPSSPFCANVAWLVDAGITTGYPDGSYQPGRGVLRQEMAAFLFRYANPETTPTSCGEAPFDDVAASSPFCGYIEWLVGEGITTGTGDGRFGAAGKVTRGAMAAFMYRLANPGAPAPTCAEAPFDDVAADHPFCGYIDWLATTGVTTGYPDGTFRPGATVQRDVMAAFLNRLDDHLN